MLNSKLIRLIDTFLPYEYSEFSKFLRSPFFNKKEDLIELYDYVHNVRIKKLTKDIHLEKTKTYNNLFPNDKFDGEKMRRLMSDLSILVKEYMVIRELKRDDKIQLNLSIRSYDSRNLTDLHHKELNKYLKELNKIKHKKPTDYLDLYSNTLDVHLFPYNSRLDPSLNNYEIAHHNLNQFYFISKLHLCCELVNRQIIFNQKKSIPFLKKVEKWIAKKQFVKQPVFEVYLTLLELLKKGYNKNKFNHLTKIFFNNLTSFNDKQQYELFLILCNIVNRNLQKGCHLSSTILLHLFKNGLEQKILPYQKRITNETFTNIVVLAAIESDFLWVEKFITRNTKYLPKSTLQQTQLFCNGFLHFSKGNYEEAMKIMNTYSFDKSSFDIRAKYIQIKAMFEMLEKDEDIFQPLLDKTEAFIKYVQRKDIGDEKIESYTLFSRYAKNIARLMYKKELTEKKKEYFEEKINSHSILLGKTWLLEKIK